MWIHAKARCEQHCRGLATARLKCGRRRNAGSQCSGCHGGLASTRFSAKGTGTRAGAHRALDWLEAWCRVVGVAVRRLCTGGAWGGGRCRAPPGFWVPRAGAGMRCEGARRVSTAGGTPAATKFPNPVSPVAARAGCGVAERRVHGGAECSTRWSKARRAELGFVAAVEARAEPR